MKNKTTHTDNEFLDLESLKSKNGFETPTSYFDSLHDSIMNEVKLDSKIEKTKVKQLSFYKVFGYAASILLIAGVFSLFFIQNSNPNEGDLFGNLTVSEYMEEFQEIDLELDEALLFDEMALN